MQTIPEKIKKAFAFYLEAGLKSVGMKEHEPEYKKAEALAQRRYNAYAKLCEKEGLNAYHTGQLLNEKDV